MTGEEVRSGDKCLEDNTMRMAEEKYNLPRQWQAVLRVVSQLE
jgi:hypothetical protein